MRTMRFYRAAALPVLLAAVFGFAACGSGNGDDAAYVVGDTGPAGGTVFYVKDAYSDGWRYLEAAPIRELSEATNWVPHDTAPVNLLMGGTAIGSGKRNTEIILEKLAEWGVAHEDHDGREVAAKACDEFAYGEKSDWFLPSKDELNEMYKQRDILGVDELGAIIDEKWDYPEGWKSDEGWVGRVDMPVWSSSEYDEEPDVVKNAAWMQCFGSGGAWHHSWKSAEILVWAVRAF